MKAAEALQKATGALVETALDITIESLSKLSKPNKKKNKTRKGSRKGPSKKHQASVGPAHLFGSDKLRLFYVAEFEPEESMI